MSPFPVRATELRRGDLIHVGGTNYVLAADVKMLLGRIRIKPYNGTEPAERWTLSFNPYDTVDVAGRDLGPADEYTDPPRFPEGTPQHATYRAELTAELAKFAAGEDPYPYRPVSAGPEE